MINALHPETIAVRAGRPARVSEAPLNAPMVPASAYHHGGELSYARDGNPSWAAFEQALGELERGHCVAFATGLAASSAILDVLPVGARVVTQQALYHGVADQFRERARRGHIVLDALPTASPATLEPLVHDAAMVWVESPTNPMLEVVDLEAVAGVAHAAGALVVVDNTFATPLRQTPLALGADLVLHSATKLIGGHSDLLLGAALARDAKLDAHLRTRRHSVGATPGTLEVYLALRGLRTLPTRLARAEASARTLAEKLRQHPRVACVRYPGSGMMISFEVDGSAQDTEAICEACELIVHATSLGGVETTLERRARYSSERLAGTPDALIRLSVGLEHPDDLLRDLHQALTSDGAEHHALERDEYGAMSGREHTIR